MAVPKKRTGHTLEADIRLENLNEFKSITKTFEEESGIASLEDFLNEVSLVSDVNDQKNDNSPKVTLMTIHAVRGIHNRRMKKTAKKRWKAVG